MSFLINRRGLIAGLTAAIAAPAVVRAASLMPVRAPRLVRPLWRGAITLYINGDAVRVVHADGSPVCAGDLAAGESFTLVFDSHGGTVDRINWDALHR